MADAGVRQVVVTQPVIRATGNSHKMHKKHFFLNIITVVLETRDETKKSSVCIYSFFWIKLLNNVIVINLHLVVTSFFISQNGFS